MIRAIKFLGLFVVLINLSLIPAAAQEPSDTNVVHLYGIGNLADLSPGAMQVKALSHQISEENIPSIIVFTGDLTKLDLTVPHNRMQDSIRLFQILNTLHSELIQKFVFLPGDRDWSYSGKLGWENVRILEEIIENLPFKQIEFKPGKGCPGPKEIEITDDLLLVILNTQYWNHPYKRPEPVDALCDITSREEFFEELEDIISESHNQNVLVTGHFPVLSHGEYGGRIPMIKHIFPLRDMNPALWVPLPVVGSFYPSFRQNIGSSMDIINERYTPLNEGLKNIIKDHPGLIYLSGHEYSLEVIFSNNSYYVSSGAMEEIRPTGTRKNTVYRGRETGLCRIEYTKDGTVSAHILNFSEEELQLTDTIRLFSSACEDQNQEIPVNEFFIPCKEVQSFPDSMSSSYPPSTEVVAGNEYEAGKVKELFFGSHYRKAWTTKIQVPYLNLDTTFGGLTPTIRGGGRQTTSLKFKNKDGCEFVFRSVNKDPKKALSYDLRETIVADVVKDQTSTQHPYGALATSPMLDALEILHPRPVVYLLPPDEKLGRFREDYSNLLGMLEESPKGPKSDCPGFEGSDDVLRSYKLFHELYKDHDSRIDDKEFAKARVFDILVGDWGRHEDNWKWAGYEAENGMIFRPVPRDRDHVFSVWDGIFPWIADREWAKPSGEHFGYSVKDVRSLTWSSRHLDRVLLTGLSKSDWIDQISEVQETLSDSVVQAGINNMPPEIVAVNGDEIREKILSRRENLHSIVLDYYQLLAQYVDVLGSRKKEIFRVSRLENGAVRVKVTDKKGEQVLYHRTFNPEETKEVRLFGLGNKDKFFLEGHARKSILIRVVGGTGADVIIDSSTVQSLRKKTFIYEKDPGSFIYPGEEGKTIYSRNPDIYRYQRHSFVYPTYFPMPFIGYNADDKLILGLGITFSRQRYGKPDFSTRHRLDFQSSISGNLQFQYVGRIHHVIRKWDFIYSGLAAYPTDYVSFYGYGNETVKSDSLYRADYYNSRYNSIRLSSGLLHDFLKRSSFSIILAYENNDGQISRNTILDQPVDILGTGKINLLEASAILDLDFRSDKTFPEKGMRFFTALYQGMIASNDNSTYTKWTGFIEFHSVIQTFFPLFIGLRGGGALSSGDLPFYKLNNLGQNNYLRGYRKNRFSGRSMMFVNSDLKIQFLDIATPVVPIKLGLRGFFDIGKVYIDGENSETLHAGYGGGFYLIPLSKAYSMALNLAFSEEEKHGLIVFELGIKF